MQPPVKPRLVSNVWTLLGGFGFDPIPVKVALARLEEVALTAPRKDAGRKEGKGISFALTPLETECARLLLRDPSGFRDVLVTRPGTLPG